MGEKLNDRSDTFVSMLNQIDGVEVASVSSISSGPVSFDGTVAAMVSFILIFVLIGRGKRNESVAVLLNQTSVVELILLIHKYVDVSNVCLLIIKNVFASIIFRTIHTDFL